MRRKSSQAPLDYLYPIYDHRHIQCKEEADVVVKMRLIPAVFLLVILLSSISSSCVIRNVTVSADGTDSSSCLKRSSIACRSLQYVLATAGSCTRVLVTTDQELTHELQLKGISNLTVEGDRPVIVSCLKQGAGLSFNNGHKLTLSQLHFQGCGWKQYQSPVPPAAVSFQKCSDITVTKCSFSSSNYTGLALLNVIGSVAVADSVFSDLSPVVGDDSSSVVGLYLSLTEATATLASFAITSCNFTQISNTHKDSAYLMPHHHGGWVREGGGLVVIIKNASSNNDLVIADCKFTDNRAWIGGGGYVLISAHSRENTLLITKTQFVSNLATSFGGGLYIGITDTELVQILPQQVLNGGNVTIQNSSFIDNRADQAAGLAYQNSGQGNETSDAITTIVNCRFEGNIANVSGFAMALFKLGAGKSVKVELSNCTIVNNTYSIRLATPSSVLGNGVLYTQEVPISFRKQTIFRENWGSTILASSTSLYFHDTVSFIGNRGVRGGALSLFGRSRVVVGKGARITFQENHGEQYGGAVYETFPVQGVVGMDQYCMFEYEDREIINASLWDADIWFINNTAGVSGQTLFISSSDSCQLDADGRPFTENSTYHFNPQTLNQVSSPVAKLNFSGEGIDVHEDGSYWSSGMLGQEMNLNVTAIDQWGQTVNGFVTVHLGCVKVINGVWKYDDVNCGYSLGGTRLVELTGEPVRTSFFVQGERLSNSSSHIVLVWEMIQDPPSLSFLFFTVTECKLGYVYDSDLKHCVCFQSENVACIKETYTACVQRGYWFGKVLDNQFASYVCPFGNCNYTIGKDCPTEQCGSDHQFFCKLPEKNSDTICYESKGDVMCAGCRQNYTLTFEALTCAPDDQCSIAFAFLILFFVLLFWVMIVSVLLVVVRLDLHVGSGKLYCFIFYFSVLQFFVGGSFPSEGLYIIEIILSGFIQLNPKVFGLIRVCVSTSINKIQYTMLRYINPIFLALVVLFIVLVSRKCYKLNIFNHTSRGINTICILLYLAFLSLSFTSLELLLPVRFNKINGTYVEIDPTITYFHPTQHLPYAIIAIAVEVFFVIPFLLLLTLYPFLLQFKKLNLTRVKPIFDEYQSCYKDHLRSFSGFYLIALQIIFLLRLFNLGTFGSIYFLQIFSILMLTVHSVVQPYREQWLNVLDALIILDLVLLSILHGNTANIVFDDVEGLKTTLVYLLILLPMMYFLLLCFMPGIKWVLNFTKKWCLSRKWVTERLPINHNEQQEVVNSTTQQQLENSCQDGTLEREPLLFTPEMPGYSQSNYAAAGDQNNGERNASHRPSCTIVELSNSSEWGRHYPSHAGSHKRSSPLNQVLQLIPMKEETHVEKTE